MKYLKQFYLFLVGDASSARNLGCEIRAAQSRDCQYSNQITVNPDSNVTLNCSVRNDGTTLGMTWKQVKETLKSSYGLVLKRANSTTLIYFTSKWYFNKHCTAFIPHLIEQTAVIYTYICIHLRGERVRKSCHSPFAAEIFHKTNKSFWTDGIFFFLMTSGWYLFRITG